jgi:spore maturation protein B
MFRAGGALDILTRVLAPAFALVGIPEEIIPFVIMRPISGSGSTAMLSDLFSQHGADTYAGRAASVIMASSETAIYVCSVYFGAVGVKRTKQGVPIVLAAQIICAVTACFLVRIML